MSTPIRPPGGPFSPGATGAVEGASGVEPGQAAKVAEAGAASRAAPAAPAAVQSSTEVLLNRLDAGEVTREQAIEQLVAEALEVHGGARLAAAQRSALQEVLRAALLDDPVLGRLLG